MKKKVDINFLIDCSTCLHEAAHLVLTYVLTGSTPHGASVEPGKDNIGHIADPAFSFGLYPIKAPDSVQAALRTNAENFIVIHLSGREAERKAFPGLSKSYGTDGKKVRMILENFEKDLKKRRAWNRELRNRVDVELDRWWSLIVMTAIILQIKRTLDRDAIWRILERIDAITGDSTCDRLTRGRTETA